MVDDFNRFEVLFKEDLNKDNVEQAYSNLIEDTEKAALDQFPKKIKAIKFDAKNNHIIIIRERCYSLKIMLRITKNKTDLFKLR